MPEGRTTYYAHGDWNAICDRCGGKFKGSQLRRTWEGYMTCERCWEPRQAQDFVKGIPDMMAPPWQRPVPAPQFASVNANVSVSADYTFVTADAFRGVEHPATDAAARSWTVPHGVFPPMTVLTAVNDAGAGVVTLTSADRLTMGLDATPGNRTLAAGGTAYLQQIADNEWLVWGTGVS